MAFQRVKNSKAQALSVRLLEDGKVRDVTGFPVPAGLRQRFSFGQNWG